MRASGLVTVDVIVRKSRLPRRNALPMRSEPLLFKIEGALVVQEGEVAEDILFDLLRCGLRINLLQFRDDLPDCVLGVAALDDLQTWAVEAQRALGHEQHALVVVFAEA